jgi:hypothetical protein
MSFPVYKRYPFTPPAIETYEVRGVELFAISFTPGVNCILSFVAEDSERFAKYIIGKLFHFAVACNGITTTPDVSDDL